MTEQKNEWQEAKEVQSNWFKFVNIGDKIKGTLINKRFQKSDDLAFADQWVYELKTEDGNVWNVGISVKKSGTIQRINNCKLGEIIGILFESEGKSAVKGGAKAKNLKVFSWGMDATYQVINAFGGKEVEEDEIKINEAPFK